MVVKFTKRMEMAVVNIYFRNREKWTVTYKNKMHKGELHVVQNL